MSRAFPLAGLLRLRQVQKEQAASDAAAAAARRARTTARQEKTRLALGGTGTETTSTASLYAVAAARAASRSMLAELSALECEHSAAQQAANETLREARARSIALEKLEARHDDEVHAEELRTEQAVLDELATTGWHRNTEDS